MPTRCHRWQLPETGVHSMSRVKKAAVGAGLMLLVGGLLAATLTAPGAWRALWAPGAAPAAQRPLLAGGTVDVGFAQHMALHHDQVVVLGNLVQKNASPMIAALGRKLAADQLVEIGEMKGWLMLWQQPWLLPSTEMRWMVVRSDTADAVGVANYLDLCAQTPGGLPGTATTAELDALAQARGPVADKLFLQYLIRHHQGAMPMAAYAAQHAETLAVQQAAWRMLIDQGKEVMQMGAMLRAMGESPLPASVPSPDLGELVARIRPTTGKVVPRLDQQHQLMPGTRAGG